MNGKITKVIKLLIAIFMVTFFCEYLIYYVVISQCSWPELGRDLNDSPFKNEVNFKECVKPVKALIIADIHLLNSSTSNWFDKLRREWQMSRSFQTALTLFQPEVVFMLGDIFDADTCNDDQFAYFVKRLNSLFQVSKNVTVFLVARNPDVGFHYSTPSYFFNRFVTELKASSVRLVSFSGNHFILLNGMAMEGDGCSLSRSAQRELNKIAKKLNCAKDNGKCLITRSMKQYSRPILLQHFPMYRRSNQDCSEFDGPSHKKQQLFKQRDCLSRDASKMIYDNFKPRLIFSGHTHHGCHVIHQDDIHEYSVPSFNWRHRNNPNFLLVKFWPDNYAVSKCQLPQESTVIFLYCLSCFLILLWIILIFVPVNKYLSKFQRKFD